MAILLHEDAFWSFFEQFHRISRLGIVTWGHCTNRGFVYISFIFRVIFTLCTTSIALYIKYTVVESLEYMFEDAKSS